MTRDAIDDGMKKHSRTIALALILALMGGFVIALIPATAQAAPAKTSMSFDVSRSVLESGQTSTLTAKYVKSGKTQKSGVVHLQHKVGKLWYTIRTVKIGKSGVAKTVVQPPVNRQYRVVSPDRKAISPTRTVTLKDGITLKSSASTVTKGQSVTFSVESFKKSRPVSGRVQIQHYASGKWTTQKTVTLSKGRATWKTTSVKSGKYRARDASTGKVSSSKTVTVKSPVVKPVVKVAAKPSTIEKGKSAVLTGTVTRSGKAASDTIRLDRASGSTWVTEASKKPSKGSASFTVKPSTSTKYRVVAGGVASSSVTVTVKADTPPKPTTPPAEKAVTYWVDAPIPLNVRSEPSTAKGKATVIGTFQPGAKVTHTPVKTNISDGWLVVSDGKLEGWVYTPYLKAEPPAGQDGPAKPEAPKAVTYYVTATALNVRASAGGTQLTTLPLGEPVTHVPGDDTTTMTGTTLWREVSFAKRGGHTTGWVSDNYLSLENPKDNTTAPTPPTTPAGKAPATFTFTGAGFGHGIGMSQYGAYQMAREGNSATKILNHYYRGTKVASQTTPDTINVQILGPEPYGFTGYADNRTSTTARLSAGTWQLSGASNKPSATTSNLPASYTLAVSTSGSKIKASVMNGSRVVTSITDSAIYMEWSGTDYLKKSSTRGVVTVAGAQGTYTHGRLIIKNKSSRVNVVNQLALNTEYLYGIAEMPSSWGLNSGAAALQSQAITARSYALSKFALKSACDCHVVDDVRDQNFVGWKKEGEGSNQLMGRTWKAAVDATVDSRTKADVLTYNERPVATHYYSYSGGRTANSEDVWSSVVPWERSESDPYSLRAPGSPGTWKHTVSQQALKNVFRNLPDIEKVRIDATYSSGQLKTVTATSTTGKTQTLTKKADQWRTAIKGTNNKINTTSLPGPWITSIAGN